jgi:hypothetical protein
MDRPLAKGNVRSTTAAEKDFSYNADLAVIEKSFLMSVAY